MACPACQRPLSSTSNGVESISRTHDVSHVNAHIATEDWLQQVSNAIHAAWPGRFLGYSRAAVLMLTWEKGDIDNQSIEFKRLEQVFKEEFHYEVQEWQIPWKRSVNKLMVKVEQMYDQYYGRNNLLIIYYAGHARRGDQGGSHPFWFPCKRKDHMREVDIPEVNIAFLSSLLAVTDEDAPDVLTLYDCCHPLCTEHPSKRSTRAVIESLCAGGFESEVPMPGQDSFTWHLVEELSLAANSESPTSIPELHKKLVGRLGGFQERSQWNKNGTRRTTKNGNPVFTKDGRRTPVYIALSVNEPLRTIMLAPMPKSQETNPRSLQSIDASKSSNQKQNSPSVLLIVRVLENEDHVKDKVKNWLINSPAGVVEFKGFYQSYSTLILVQVAFEVWDLLRPCDAVSFAGFAVTAVATDLFSTPTYIPSMAPIRSEEDVAIPTETGPMQLPSGSSKGNNLEPPSPSVPKIEIHSEVNAQQQTLFSHQPDLDSATKLLDLVERLPREKISEWKFDHYKFRVEASLSKALFTEFSRSLALGDDNNSIALSKALIFYEDLLSQYLIVRDLVQSNDPCLDIHGRLKYMLLFKVDNDNGSVIYPEDSVHDMLSVSGTRPSSLWSGASSRTSITGYEPSVNIPVVTAQQIQIANSAKRDMPAQPPQEAAKHRVSTRKESTDIASIKSIPQEKGEGTVKTNKDQVINNKASKSAKDKQVPPESNSTQQDRISKSKHRNQRKNTASSPSAARVEEKGNTQTPSTGSQEQLHRRLSVINEELDASLELHSATAESTARKVQGDYPMEPFSEQRPSDTDLATQGQPLQEYQNDTTAPSTQEAGQKTKSPATRMQWPSAEHKDISKNRSVSFSSKVEDIQPEVINHDLHEDDTNDQESAGGALLQYGDSTFDNEPRASNYLGQIISPYDESLEYIDTRFKICPSSQYEPGNVFKVVWAEPRATPEGANSFLIVAKRFIIVATEIGSSVCVPILTYEGRGCTKRGTIPQNHAIVYTPPKKPRLIQGEPEMGFNPIRMEMHATGETLSRESRVNLSKLETVAHNVEVMFIGSIYPEDVDKVNDAVEACWARRIRGPEKVQKKKKSRHSRR